MQTAPGAATPQTSTKAAHGLLAVIALGSLLAAATSSIINIALPDIARDFHVDPSQAAWFVLSFLLTVTVLLLVAGRVADVVGHGRVYVAGYVVFGLASAWCAIAGSPASLIGARVLQGAASSLVMAAGPALVTLALPPQRRGFALGLISTGTYVGLAVGPPLGGSLVAAYGWRSIFWLTLVAAIAIAIASYLSISTARPPKKETRFDYVGALLTAVGTLSFLLAATRWSAWGLTHPATISAAVIAVLAMPIFIWVELRHPAPTLDLRLFRSRVFSSATLSALLNYVSLFIALYAMPFALRDGQHMSPPQAGRVMGTLALAMAALAWRSGMLSDRIGSRGLAAGGMTVLAVGMGALALAWPTHGMWTPALLLLVCGAGTGVFISPNSSALMGAAPRDRQGVAGGVMGLARNLGMTLGVATASGLFASVFGATHTVGAWSVDADRIMRVGFLLSALAALGAAAVALIGRPSGQQPSPAA